MGKDPLYQLTNVERLSLFLRQENHVLKDANVKRKQCILSFKSSSPYKKRKYVSLLKTPNFDAANIK